MFSSRSDPEWRSGWLDTVAEPLERYSRINDRLLDGCESAYTAIADEFHSDAPDWEALVESGALEPELAIMLQEAREKWTAAGRRPEISVGRVNGQVLLIDGSQPEVAGFVATVVFRSRELRTWAPLGEKSSAASSSSSSSAASDTAADADDADDNGTVASVQFMITNKMRMQLGNLGYTAAEIKELDPGKASRILEEAGVGQWETPAKAKAPEAVTVEGGGGDHGVVGGGAEDEYEDHIQLWTFTAEHLHMRPYVMWLRDTISQQQGGSSSSASSTSDSGGGEGGDGEGQQEAPVRWRLTDINFVVQDYVPPAGPTEPSEVVNELLTRSLAMFGLVALLSYTLYKLGKREAERRQARPLGMPPIGGGLQPRRPLGGMGAAAADGGMGGGAGSTSSFVQQRNLAPTWAGSDGGGGGALRGGGSGGGGGVTTNQYGDEITSSSPSQVRDPDEGSQGA